MYADITTSRVSQHRAAMEKHAAAARRAKVARSAASVAPRTAPTQGVLGFKERIVTSLAGRVRPVPQAAPRPVTV